MPPEGAAALVGRQDEVGALRAALEAACAGRGGTMLLGGEAGIGKTRLAGEVAAEAAARGAGVAWGRGSEDAGAPPLWPWVQIARTITDAVASSSADDDAEHALADLGGAEGPGAWRDEGSRFRFFDALGRALAARARARPWVVVLDDLHWADEATVAFLRFIARVAPDLPLLLVATYRDTDVAPGHPIATALGELARERGSARLVLSGLAVDDARRLVEGRLGLPVAGPLLDAVHARTGGNPFFLTETFTLLARDGRLVVGAPEPAFALALAPTVGDVVARRLERLSPAARAVLGVLALRGEGAGVALLRAVPSLRDADIAAALDEAEAAGMVAMDPERPGTYLLHHPMVGDVLRQRQRSVERARLHLELAEALSGAHGDDPGPIVAELAHHFVQAAPVAVDERTWRWAVAAGHQAAALYAHDDAVRWYRHALAAADAGAPAGDGDRIDVLVALGRAARRGGDTAAADTSLERAAARARRVGDAARLADVAVAWSELRLSLARDPRRVALLDEALAGLPPDDRARRAAVLTAQVGEWCVADAERARAASVVALDEARASGEPRAVVAALAARRLAAWGPDCLAEHEAVSRELADLAPLHWPEQVVEGLHGLAIVALERGDLGGFRRQAAALEAAAERYRSPLQGAWSLVMRALLATLEGRLDDADRSAGEAVTLCSQAEMEAPLQVALVQPLVTAWERGAAPAPGTDALVTGDGTLQQTWRCGLLLLASLPGEELRLRAALEAVWPGAEAVAVERDMGWLARQCSLAHAVVAIGDRARARVLADRLAPYSDRLACLGVGLSVGPVAYHLGRLRALIGDERHGGAGVPDLEAALSWAVRERVVLWGARAQVALAGAVAADDPERARQLATAAAATAAEVGLPALAGDAEAVLSALAGREAGAAAPPDGLTSREVEVLARLAAGDTNAQLALRLHLSIKTIERHLSNIYTKLGVRGRAEAAAYAQRHALVDGATTGPAPQGDHGVAPLVPTPAPARPPPPSRR